MTNWAIYIRQLETICIVNEVIQGGKINWYEQIRLIEWEKVDQILYYTSKGVETLKHVEDLRRNLPFVAYFESGDYDDNSHH
jgi:hypothetical protein